MDEKLTEEMLGRTLGADTYIELVMSYPELRDRKIRDIANESARLALICSRDEETRHMVPALVTKAIIKEVEDMTYQSGRFNRQ